MLATLINKELRAIIYSPKFIGTFAACSLLILLSVFTGIREYKSMADRYDANLQLVDQQLREGTSWAHMTTKVYRAPDPMQIFVAGLDYDVGRWSQVTNESTAKLRNSAYSDEPIFALFRFIDFSFIVQFILTLFAILFTFDAVNGEREDGTLRLVFSNSVSRARYLLGKCIGSWLGLVVPICIPILLGLLMILAANIPLDFSHWLRIFSFLALSLLLFTFFIVLGVFISSLTRHSSVSFLVGLVVWVAFVMIIPRASVMAAGNLVQVPRIAEIEGQISGFSKERWEQFFRSSDQGWNDYEDASGQPEELTDEMLWTMMERHDSARKVVEEEIIAYDVRVHEDLRQRKARQENLAFMLSRLSPTSAYQLGAMSLASTDIEVKSRYEEAINNYREQFYQHVERKKKESGDLGMIMMSVSIDEDGNQKAATSGDRKEQNALDVSGTPRFAPPSVSLAEAVSPAVVDFGLLVLYTFLAFAGSFVAFIRYDVR
jgi:ABC-type transport system involved in multi-copper enzyme maturation permease subunit